MTTISNGKGLSADENIRQILLSSINPIQAAVIECMSILFNQEWTTKEAFTLTERLISEDDWEHTISLGCSNDNYRGLIAVSLSTKALSILLGCEIDDGEYHVDALGEYANNLQGVLMDIPEITASFGTLKPSLPLYSTGQSWYPKAWAIHGRIYKNDLALYLGFAIRSASPIIL